MKDQVIFDLINEEKNRQLHGIELIASENFTSPQAMEAMGSVLTNKYAEGLPGKRYYGGCEQVDVVEELAIERAKILFGADHANVQPHAGANANAATAADATTATPNANNSARHKDARARSSVCSNLHTAQRVRRLDLRPHQQHVHTHAHTYATTKAKS